MQETRQNRIARLLQKELASIFQSQTRAMHGVLVSVTRVKVSPYFHRTKPKNFLQTLTKTRKLYDTI